MVNFLSIISNFYRRFIWISLVINVLLYFFSFSLGVAIIVKLILSILLYRGSTVTERGKGLIFYNNLGWSSEKLFFLSFFIDGFLLLLTYSILQVFL